MATAGVCELCSLLAIFHEEKIYIYKQDTVKPVLSGQTKRDQNFVFKTDYYLMLVKVLKNAPREHSANLHFNLATICI